MDLVLDDDDFTHFDNSTRIKIFDAVGASDYLGLVIAAPRAVDTRASTELPVVIVSAVTALDEWRLLLPQRTVLVALDRDDITYLVADYLKRLEASPFWQDTIKTAATPPRCAPYPSATLAPRLCPTSAMRVAP